jgi:hypothetical protein
MAEKSIKQKFITDVNCKRVSVILDIETYECLMEEIEDLEDLVDTLKYQIEKLEGTAKAAIPLDEIIQKRKLKKLQNASLQSNFVEQS